MAPGTEITLTFADESVVAVAGCNTMTGGFAIDDGVLEVDRWRQTMMACPDEVQAQDVMAGRVPELGTHRPRSPTTCSP